MGELRAPTAGDAEAGTRGASVEVRADDHRHSPLVIAVLLNWNGCDDTLACLRSLDGLTYERFDVVVVENGSTDDSETRLREAHPDLQIVRTDVNLGFAGGCNLGISRAIELGADYVWLLNNDTEVATSALSEMVSTARASPRVGGVGSVLYDFDDRDRIQMWGGGRIDFLSGMCRPFIAPVGDDEVQFVSGASLLLSVPAVKEVGDLDERYFMYWEDTDLGFRLRKNGWQLVIAPKSSIYHKEAASTGYSNPTYSYMFNRSAVRFFAAHAGVPIVPIVLGATKRMFWQFVGREWRHLVATVKGFGEGVWTVLVRRSDPARRLDATRPGYD